MLYLWLNQFKGVFSVKTVFIFRAWITRFEWCL